MNFKIMKKTFALFTSLFGAAPIINLETQQLDLTADQRQMIADALGADAESAIEGVNQEIKNMANSNTQMLAIKHEIDAMVELANLTNEELNAVAKDEDGNPDLAATIKKVQSKQKEQSVLLKKLMEDSEGDVPLKVIRNVANAIAEHSSTHLFGSNKAYDAFDGGRSWNKRMLNNSLKATDFNNSGTIPLLQSDLEHFVNDNSGMLTSLFIDFEDLPSEWSRRSGVLDRVSDGFIIPAEIVQGRSKGFSPKNNFKITSEDGRVFRKKIDITFDGYELQKMENTWIRSYNKEGSNPWKMSFIGFLLGELIKRQKLDDRIAQINGIYVESPENHAGAAVNSQNGLRYLWFYHRDVKQNYRAFDIGLPTESNIVDYIEQMILLMPERERSEQGNEIQISSKWMKAYQKRAGEIYLLQRSTDQGVKNYDKKNPIDYPNFIFQELKDQTKTDFIAITKSNNIQILDYDTSEKGKFTVTHEKRDTHLFADYRLGIRIISVGMKLEDGDPREFEVQEVWSNNAPIFHEEVYVPAFDDTTGNLKTTFPRIAVDDKWKTNITAISGATKGSVIKIKGNSGMVATKNVVNNTNLLLASDFDLQSGGTLVLFAQEDGKFKELSRSNAPQNAATTDIDFTSAIIDVKGGVVFRYTGTSTKAITSLVNGIEGKTIKIYGTNTADVNVTLSDTGNINVGSDATLGDNNDYIQLTYVDNVWIETGRSITL